MSNAGTYTVNITSLSSDVTFLSLYVSDRTCKWSQKQYTFCRCRFTPQWRQPYFTQTKSMRCESLICDAANYAAQHPARFAARYVGLPSIHKFHSAVIAFSLYSQYLPAVTKAGRSPEADLCRMPPITCNPQVIVASAYACAVHTQTGHFSSQGKLLQLALPGAGLNCGGQGLPPSFSKLTELQILDVAYNEIGGTTEAIGELIGKV